MGVLEFDDGELEPDTEVLRKGTARLVLLVVSTGSGKNRGFEAGAPAASEGRLSDVDSALASLVRLEYLVVDTSSGTNGIVID